MSNREMVSMIAESQKKLIKATAVKMKGGGDEAGVVKNPSIFSIQTQTTVHNHIPTLFSPSTT